MILLIISIFLMFLFCVYLFGTQEIKNTLKSIFKKTIKIITILFIIGIISFFIINGNNKNKLISKEQIKDNGFSLRINKSYVFSNTLLGSITGQIENTSNLTVSSIKYKITIRDCYIPNDISTCITIGEDTAYASIVIPPKQVRQIDVSVYFPDVPEIKNNFSWSIETIEIVAKK